jgi:hypothetical protein
MLIAMLWMVQLQAGTTDIPTLMHRFPGGRSIGCGWPSSPALR